MDARLIYNQENLPLSPKKFIKKFLARIFRGGFLLFPLIIFSGFFIGFYTLIKSGPGSSLPSLSEFIFGNNIELVILAVIILWLLYCLIYEYLYYRLYAYSFGDDSAEIKKGVISRATGVVRYQRLQNIYIDQDWLDRIFGLYDVHYETAGETSRFYSHVDGLIKENSDKLSQFLSDKASKSHQLINNKINNQHMTIQNETQTNSQSQNNNVLLSVTDYPISQKLLIASPLITGVFFGIFGGAMTLPLFPDITRISIPIRFIFAFIIVYLITFIVMKVWIKNFSFKFYSDRGEIFKKIIGQNSSIFYYDRIQNVNVTQTFLERFFGLYNVSIETAGGGANTINRLLIPGQNKDSAEKIKNFILEKSRNYRGGGL